MSEPLRYDPGCEPDTLETEAVAVMFQCPNGDWVKYAEYAKIKSELKRLREASFVTAVPVAEYEKMKADNDRLLMVKEATVRMIKRRDNWIAEHQAKMTKALLKAMDWQPIETAPKDGSWLLLATDSPDKPSGIDDLDCWLPPVGYGRYVDGEGWMKCSEYSVSFEPTHWMHTPQPPTK